MVDIINLFLSIFSGIIDFFVNLSIGGYKVLSFIFAGFVLSVIFVYITGVIRRR